MTEMNRLLAIDPGTTQSAFVWMACAGGAKLLLDFGIIPNDQMLAKLAVVSPCYVVIEQIASYGMAVGAEVFETVFWSGRFAQAAIFGNCDVSRLPRRDVKIALCGSMKAKDANIRQALIDRYGGVAATKKGGALHGVSKDVWAALGVAETWLEKRRTAR